MNWGHKIIIVYAVFVSGIVFLVYKSSIQKMDLVTTDYYGKELKYQQKIDQLNRVNNLSDSIRLNIKDQQLVIQFPKDFDGKKLTGDIVLYCPADEDRDLNQTFSGNTTSIYMPMQTAKKGSYQIKLSWHTDDGLDYYLERRIVII